MRSKVRTSKLESVAQMRANARLRPVGKGQRMADDIRSDATKANYWAEWMLSAGSGDVSFTPLSELSWTPAGIRALPPPPNDLPPPPPVEKACSASICSVISEDSTDCVSEPSGFVGFLPPPPNGLPPPPPVEKARSVSTCSVISEDSTDCVSEPSGVAGSEVGDQAFTIWGSVEIDFDSLVFELSPDDVSDAPSSIRSIPSSYADEIDPELQRLLDSDTYGSHVRQSCKLSGGTCGSTRLSSRARAWAPGASLHGAPVGVACSQMLEILVAVQAAMASSGLASEGGILERPAGWAITMYVHATNLVLKEQIIMLGKASLIEHSKRSQNIYVLGYCNQPFVITPMGFSAILCEAENSNACWEFVQTGFCRFRNGCKWRHPSCQAVVSVMIKIKESD